MTAFTLAGIKSVGSMLYRDSAPGSDVSLQLQPARSTESVQIAEKAAVFGSLDSVSTPPARF
jgi:hypothetical protein